MKCAKMTCIGQGNYLKYIILSLINKLKNFYYLGQFLNTY